ncbi:hypothetical protein DPMN_096221 [Dreissena polymorpha]|uniref:Uncharacterized protein n=1 Tax=Dreissena polymorpha TaxID=45954 RepID=A0A9D4L9C3_DREPO|nr:hypothetical protein DPMN_096221 [Dreissena polymorpha]
MQACEGCGLSTANVSEGCLLQLAAALFFSIIFVGDPVWQADLEDLPDAGVGEDLYFLYGGDRGSPGLCIEE